MKKDAFFTIFGLVFAIVLFITVSFSWFTMTKSATLNQLNVSIESGIFKSYQINYYKNDMVYKTTSNDTSIYEYDGSSWVLATYTSDFDIDALDNQPDYDPADYYGVTMIPYDTLIPENNDYNNLIIGMHLVYEVDTDTYVSARAVTDQSIGEEARDAFGVLEGDSDELYLSEVLNIQMLPYETTDLHGFYNPSNGLYSTLSDVTYFGDTTTYPYKDFYTNDVLGTSISLYDGVSDIFLDHLKTDLYLYFNYSYNASRVDEVLSTLITSEFSNIEIYRFFQDVTIFVRKESEV